MYRVDVTTGKMSSENLRKNLPAGVANVGRARVFQRNAYAYVYSQIPSQAYAVK